MFRRWGFCHTARNGALSQTFAHGLAVSPLGWVNKPPQSRGSVQRRETQMTLGKIRIAALAATFLAGTAALGYAQSSSTIGAGGSTAGNGSSSTTLGTGGSASGSGSGSGSASTLGTGGSSAGGKSGSSSTVGAGGSSAGSTGLDNA